MPVPQALVRFLGAPSIPRPADLLTADQPYKPFPPVRRWRYNALIRFLVFAGLVAAIGLVFSLVIGLVIGMVLGSAAQGSEFGRAVASWGNVIAIPVFLAAYLLLGRWWEQRSPVHELSLRRVGGVGTGLLIGTVLVSGSIGLIALFGGYRIVGVDPSYNPWFMILVAGFSAAINEEIMFRGILFRLTEDTFGTWAATAISGLVFGLVHLTNPHATLAGGGGIALEAGILFAALYAFTRSLWVCMGVHFAWNVVQGPIFGIVISGTSAQGSGWIRSTMPGPDWLTGGQFGMEASWVTIVAVTAVAIWLIVQVAKAGLVVEPFWVRRRLLRSAENPVSVH